MEPQVAKSACKDTFSHKHVKSAREHVVLAIIGIQESCSHVKLLNIMERNIWEPTAHEGSSSKICDALGVDVASVDATRAAMKDKDESLILTLSFCTRLGTHPVGVGPL